MCGAPRRDKERPLKSARQSDPPPKHLALIGYRGAGKSTIGPRVGELAGALVFDADAEVERAAQLSIAEIFSLEGEQGFRDRESAMLRQLLSGPSSILCLGGGVVLRAENRALLKSCFTVWLTAPVKVLLERLQRDAQKRSQRPALTSLPEAEEMVRLLEIRSPFYAECADLTLQTDQLTVDQAAQTILAAWRASAAAPDKR